MAPKKKNKKLATSGSRGFATTSTISKSKLLDESTNLAVENTAPLNDSAVEIPDTSIGNGSGNAEEDKQFSELTPEELEARLEDSELQILVEQYGEKAKKDATRQVSRLQTERRLFRASANQLSLSTWLPRDLSQELLERLSSELGRAFPVSSQGSLEDESAISEEALSIKIWTLRRALLGLGFMEYNVSGAITHLLDNPAAFAKANQSSTKESLWGLDHCLDWLAITCEEEELPGYDTHRTEKYERLLRSDLLLKESDAAEFNPSSSPSISGFNTPETQNSGAFSETLVNESVVSSVLDPSAEEESETEFEPQDMVDKYISLQRKLYKRRPELTKLDLRKGRKNKTKNVAIPGDIDAGSSKIIRQLQRIEDDVFFDKDEAFSKWIDVRFQLVAEDAERKQFGIRPKKMQLKEDQIQTTPPEVAETHDEDDSIAGIGEFLSSLPEERIDETTGITKTAMTLDNGTSVTIRHFGNSSGVTPRKILEEACRSRDSASRINCTLVSGSTFSCRHSLTVNWSRPQELSETVDIPGVRSTKDQRFYHIEMSDISCPDRFQSESFVSTAALFLIFSVSAKEKQVYLRLPPTWRSLWMEFQDIKKKQVEEAEKLELRNIKKMVDEHRTILDRAPNVSAVAETKNTENGAKNRVMLEERQAPTLISPLEISNLWRSKCFSQSYQRMLPARMKLPIWSFKETLIETIEAHQVIILSGETGCGKSTQVPAYILERELSQGRECKIYCTEPRRISAISLARRVSEELGEHKNDVGTSRSLVGYAIRLESQVTPRTKLIYATTGIVMRMLERGNDLENITHLVLDEVHERTIDSDFLLIVLRKLMQRRPDLKVILMSATVNAGQFSRYLDDAPVITVPGRTFPVETRYLEDAIEATNFQSTGSSKNRDIDIEEDDIDEHMEQSISSKDLQGYSTRTKNILAEFNEYRLDYDLILKLLQKIATDEQYFDYSKAILVFLPGIAEIRRLNDILLGDEIFRYDWQIFCLHSTIATEEQERAFVVPKPGTRKIVLATNIAETGITIPDVTCVVDSGKHKEMRFDERRQLSRLIESFISRANAKQRRGRAGRVQNGLCFHLFTRKRHDSLLPEAQTPEILRLSLQDLALRVKICKLGNIEQVLSEALDPPSPKNIRRAIDSLIDVKALTTGEELTVLGRQLAKLPLDVYLGKLIFFSSIFNCLDAGVTIAAILTSKSPFTAPMGNKAQADAARLAFKKGDSDIITVYNAYCAWKRVCKMTGSPEYQFCRKNFLSSQTLSNIEELKGQLVSALIEAGFLKLDDAQRSTLNKVRAYSRQRYFIDLPSNSIKNSDNDTVVASVIAWSFYPKLLSSDGKGYRNVANNQFVTLHPTSVNKGVKNLPKFLSYYHIMQSSNKSYNAHETSAAEDFAVALVCGEAEFRMYSGVLVIDGNRLRFSLSDWKAMLLLKALRNNVQEIISQTLRFPGRSLSSSQAFWFGIWEAIFTQNVSMKN